MADLTEDLQRSAAIFLNDLLQLRDHEDLLIYTDRASDTRVAQALQAQAARPGRRAEVVEVDARQPLDAQAAQLATRIREGRYHAICELSGQYFYLTEAWQAAYSSGARPYSLAGLDAAAFVRCVGRVDHQRMFALGMALRERLLEARELAIRAANGTDLRMRLGWGVLERLGAKLRGGPRAFMTHPSGYRSGFLGGQLAFRGIPHTIEGTAVVDGYLWPPDTLGRLRQPVVLRFKAGTLVDIGGTPGPARLLARWLEGVNAAVEHICLGFNPGARLDGSLVEAERAFGCVTVGFGPGLRHTDAVLREPSVFLDGRVVQQYGTLIPPALAALSRELWRAFTAAT